jgi:hypothetical protein
VTSKRALITAATAGVLIVAPATTATAAPDTGGCQEFGQSVSFLATDLGAGFGATASDSATEGPGAFPEDVVMPEQDRECDNAGETTASAAANVDSIPSFAGARRVL